MGCRKAENHMRNKAYLEEILYNEGEKPNFGKVCKNFSAVNGHLLYNENRRVVFEKELQQLIKVNITKNIWDILLAQYSWRCKIIHWNPRRRVSKTEKDSKKMGQVDSGVSVESNWPKKCMLCKIYHFLMKLRNQLRLTFVIFQKVMDLNTWLFALIISLNALKQKLSLISLHQLSQIFARRNLPPWEWPGKRILKRALHYPFHWIRFLEIKKLCNVVAENLTFSTNRKLISISWWPNFSIIENENEWIVFSMERKT